MKFIAMIIYFGLIISKGFKIIHDDLMNSVMIFVLLFSLRHLGSSTYPLREQDQQIQDPDQ